MTVKHWLAFAALIALGLALGRLKPEPQAMIEDVSSKTVSIEEPDFHRSDWLRCAPEPRLPLTEPGPGKARFHYRSRNGGTA